MSSISGGKSARQDVMSPAAQMRDFVGQAVNAHRAEGRERAILVTARMLGITPRRVVGILKGEVSRVWADELQRAQEVYARLCQAEAARLQAEADDMRRRAEEMARRLQCG